MKRSGICRNGYVLKAWLLLVVDCCLVAILDWQPSMNARTSKVGVAADLTPPQSPQSSPAAAAGQSKRLTQRISPASARSPAASPKRPAQGWSSESTHAGGESKTSMSGRSRSSKRGSPRAIMRRYKNKIKPRTLLYGTFAFVSPASRSERKQFAAAYVCTSGLTTNRCLQATY
jgi:hypothetical protein